MAITCTFRSFEGEHFLAGKSAHVHRLSFECACTGIGAVADLSSHVLTLQHEAEAANDDVVFSFNWQ